MQRAVCFTASSMKMERLSPHADVTPVPVRYILAVYSINKIYFSRNHTVYYNIINSSTLKAAIREAEKLIELAACINERSFHSSHLISSHLIESHLN